MMDLNELITFYQGLLVGINFDVICNLNRHGPVTTIHEVIAFKLISCAVFDLIFQKVKKDNFDNESNEYTFSSNSTSVETEDKSMAMIEKDGKIIVSGNGKEAHTFLRKAIELIKNQEG